MNEIQIYDQIFLMEPENYTNNKVKFIDEEIPNYRIYYKGRSIGTIKEMLINIDRKIKLKEMRDNKDFYINISAHLIAQYITKRIKRRDLEYAEYLKERRELLVEAIYRKILNGPIEKYKYLGKVWSNNEIKGSFIKYLNNRVLSL